MKKIAFLALITITSCITIERVPSKKKDDGYSSLNENQKKMITEFNSSDSKSSGRNIQWINSENVKKISSKNNITWVIIWASWCPHSINLIEKKMPIYSEKYKDLITPVLIAQNINLEYQMALLDKEKYVGNLFILNSNSYGIDEEMKSVKFLSELNIDNKEISKSTPINLLLDNKGVVLKIKYGESVTEEFFNL